MATVTTAAVIETTGCPSHSLSTNFLDCEKHLTINWYCWSHNTFVTITVDACHSELHLCQVLLPTEKKINRCSLLDAFNSNVVAFNIYNDVTVTSS